MLLLPPSTGREGNERAEGLTEVKPHYVWWSLCLVPGLFTMVATYFLLLLLTCFAHFPFCFWLLSSGKLVAVNNFLNTARTNFNISDVIYPRLHISYLHILKCLEKLNFSLGSVSHVLNDIVPSALPQDSWIPHFKKGGNWATMPFTFLPHGKTWNGEWRH